MLNMVCDVIIYPLPPSQYNLTNQKQAPIQIYVNFNSNAMAIYAVLLHNIYSVYEIYYICM